MFLDRVVAAAAVAGRLGAVLLGHHALHLLEERVHRRVAVRARQPLLVDLGVATGGAAGGRVGERLLSERAAGAGVRQAGRERPVLTVEVAVVLGELVDELDAAVGGRQTGHHQGHDQGAGQRHPGRRAEDPTAHLVPYPYRDHHDVGQREDHERVGRVEMDTPPCGRHGEAEQTLPGHHHARDEADDERRQSHVAEQHDVREAVAPVVEPVDPCVPDDGYQGQQADHGVHQNGPLHGGVEGGEGNDQTRDRQSEDCGQCDEGRA